MLALINDSVDEQQEEASVAMILRPSQRSPTHTPLVSRREVSVAVTASTRRATGNSLLTDQSNSINSGSLNLESASTTSITASEVSTTASEETNRLIMKHLNMHVRWEAQISWALNLDLVALPRKSRFDGHTIIVVHNKQQVDDSTRDYATQTPEKLGHKNMMFSTKERIRIGQATCQQASYDMVFRKSFTWQSLRRWDIKIEQVIETGDLSLLP